MYCTCWCDNRRDCDTNIPGPSSLVRDIPGPDSNQHDELGIVREDTPEILGPSLGARVDNGLSDLDESSNEEVIEISELQQFSWALQEAQQQAILLENEKAKAKQKTPKTYLGNSNATIARREKARQALVSHGFHDVFSFLASKEKEKLVRGRDLEGGEPASPIECNMGTQARTLALGAQLTWPITCRLRMSNRTREGVIEPVTRIQMPVLRRRGRESQGGEILRVANWPIARWLVLLKQASPIECNMGTQAQTSALGAQLMWPIARRLKMLNGTGEGAIKPTTRTRTPVLQAKLTHPIACHLELSNWPEGGAIEPTTGT